MAAPFMGALEASETFPVKFMASANEAAAANKKEITSIVDTFFALLLIIMSSLSTLWVRRS
jgi:hypothetical protein